MGTVCRNLRLENRWETIEPKGISGGMLMGWQNGVVIHPIKQHTFYLEVEVGEPDTNQRLWIIFLHTSTDERLRKEQWEELIEKRVQ